MTENLDIISDDVEPVFLSEFSTEEIKQLGDSTEQLLITGNHPLHFEPPIEEEYVTESNKNNRLSLIIGSFIALIIYNLFLFVDHSILSDIFNTALLVRLGIFSPLALLVIFNMSKQYPTWLRDLVKLLITVGAGISFIYLPVISKNRDAIFYFPAIILVVAFGNIFIRLPFLYASAASALLFVLFTLFFPIDPHLPRLVLYTDAIFLMASIIMTLFANYFLEREHRNRFLLGFRERIRKRILLDQNIHLSELSSIDALTGLANRREIDNYLYNLNQIRPEVLSIIMLDIDFFKQFNDLYGHAAGDSCLRQIATLIMNSVHRKRDLTGRYGGEEFIIILPETTLEDSEKIAGRILENLSASAIPHSGSSVSPFVTLSAGAACGEIAGSGNVNTVLKAADDALYRAKNNGRNQVKSISLETNLPNQAG